jgi:uncharacterized spore protein YtfJ
VVEGRGEKGGAMDALVEWRRGPMASEVVEGEPIRVGERELVPVVRVTTRVRRHAFVGTGRLAGQGWGLVRLQPVAILERGEADERRIPIHDRTAQALSGLLLAAFIIPLLLAVAVRLARRT